MSNCAVILAGGEGKRMKSNKPKTLSPVLGKPMLLWVIAFDLFFFWQANGWLMLLLPATAAVNFFLTELLRRPAGAEGWRCGGRSGNWFFGKLARKIIPVRPRGK